MITRKQIRESVLKALTGIHPNVSVFDGVVPDKLPQYSDGAIKPYIIVWAGAGTGLSEMEHLGALADVDSIRADIQTQIVGATERDVWDVADLARTKLTNHLIGNRPLKPDETNQRYAAIMVDETVTPRRRFLPLIWTINTQ